jgi:hypothetical protein
MLMLHSCVMLWQWFENRQIYLEFVLKLHFPEIEYCCCYYYYYYYYYCC